MGYLRDLLIDYLLLLGFTIARDMTAGFENTFGSELGSYPELKSPSSLPPRGEVRGVVFQFAADNFSLIPHLHWRYNH